MTAELDEVVHVSEYQEAWAIIFDGQREPPKRMQSLDQTSRGIAKGRLGASKRANTNAKCHLSGTRN